MQEFLNSKYAKIVIPVAGLALVAVFMLLTVPKAIKQDNEGNTPVNGEMMNADGSAAAETNKNSNAPKAPAKKSAPKTTGFAQIIPPHYVSASVTNNATLSEMPGTVTISFDAAINKTTESYIYVKRDDVTSVTQGQSYIGSDRKTLSVNLNKQAKDGDYYVYYVSCFADTNCSVGRFGFRLKLPQ